MARTMGAPSLAIGARSCPSPSSKRIQGRYLVHCSVAKVHPHGLVPSLSIREARIEDSWQIADTHCGVFMPNQGLLMDLALRFDRVMALLGSLPFTPRGGQKKCLVAVEEGAFVQAAGFLIKLAIAGTGGSTSVCGVLTVDNLGEFLPRKRPSGRRRCGIAYVSNVAVRKSRRRRGIAKQLLRAAERLAKSWGCRSLALHCSMDNSAAIALYAGQGYRILTLAAAAHWPRPQAGPGASQYLLLIKSLYNVADS